MVWLLIDGVEISAMNNYFLSSKDQETKVDWVNGKDFVFNYVGNASYPFRNISVPYIQIWENGVDGGQFSYLLSDSADATCTEPGFSMGLCTLCGALFESASSEVLGHNFADWTVLSEPTCSQSGQKTSTCTVCGHQETVEIPAKAHSFTSVVTPVDCEHDGFTTDTCTVCGYVQTRDQVSALGHTSVTDAGFPATCTEAGLSDGAHCGVCDKLLAAQETLPATGHAPVTDALVPATCTEAGLTEGSHCGVCGLTLTAQETILAPGHLWDEGTVTLAPAIEQEGQMRYTCATCGETRTEVLPPIPHTYAYGEWETVADPTGKAEGEQRRYCDCGDYDSQPIPKLENPFSDVTDDVFYYEPVLWAVHKGITAGSTATTFSPNETCTRAQVVTFLYRTMADE